MDVYQLKQAKDVILQLFSNPIFSQKIKDEGNFYHSFFSKWKEIIGDKLFGHIKIFDIIHYKIIVIIDHPAYIQMFKFKEKKLLNIIKSKYPKLNINGFKIILNTDISLQTETKPVQIEENEQNSDNINWNLVKNDELKSLFQKLYNNVK